MDNEGKFNDTLTVQSDDLEDRIIATGKIVAPFWTDGRVGFHATALQQTWRQMGPLDSDSPLKRTVIRTVDGQRRLDFFFINAQSPVSLDPGKELESSFAFLPFQHFQPTLPLVGKVQLSYQFDFLKSGKEADFQTIVRNFREAFLVGLYFLFGRIGGCWLDPFDVCGDEGALLRTYLTKLSISVGNVI